MGNLFLLMLLFAAPTPAERAVAEARRRVAATPRQAEGHVALAFALARRARETADPVWYARAEDAVREALRLAPDDLGALKARTWLLLGGHDFARALELARALHQRAPRDPQVNAMLVDALVETGDYAEAERAAERLLALQPGGAPALTRAAYLRELFGDLAGARELMESVLARTPAAEAEERAWLLSQIGHLHLLAADTDAAEEALARALAAFPGYHYALATLAHVRSAQGRHREAAELLEARYEAAPHPENLYELAVALGQSVRRDEAEAAFARFEREALAESGGVDNANRELVLYYADQAGRPAEALRLARAEAARRNDVHTRDALAWALHVTGRHEEARRQIRSALAVGTRDLRILAHAEAMGLADSAKGTSP